MKKREQLIVLFTVLAVGVILFSSNSVFESVIRPAGTRAELFHFPGFQFPSLKISWGAEDAVAREAWSTFENYLAYAKNHDLTGIKSLSHQISPACADPSRQSECFALMDSVYAFTYTFEENMFSHSESDEWQIILYTDGPARSFLYFTRTETGEPKVLGLRFCTDEASIGFDCTSINANRADSDNDGWWDSVESLFY